MATRRNFPLLMTALAVVAYSSAAAGAEKEKQNIIEMVEAAVRAIRSYDVHVETRSEMMIANQPVSAGGNAEPKEMRAVMLAKPLSGLYRSRQAFDAGKYRLEPILVPGKEKSSDLIVGSDELERTYDPEIRQASIRQPALQPLPYGNHYQELYRSVLSTRAIADVLRERNNVRITVEPDGRRLIVVETDPCPGENVLGAGFGYRFAFDPHLAMLPVSIEMFQLQGGRRAVWHRLAVADHKKLDDGVLVPIKAVTEFFWTKNDQFFGQVQGRQETVIDLARSRWNQPVDSKEFLVPLPAGVRVINTIRNVTFTTGKADPGKNLDELAANARNVIRHAPSLPEPAQTRWMLWIACGATAAALIAILLHLWRRARIRQISS